MDLKSIEYLKTENTRQKKAYTLLKELKIVECLKNYDPVLTGTISIGIDLPKSDLDIICECKNHLAFEKTLKQHFGNHSDFQIRTSFHYEVKSTIAGFSFKGQKIEVFGQNKPTEKQHAYRHMLIEKHILQERGSEFKRQVIALKKQGLPTEAAFAQLLGLTGNPYLALLKFDTTLIIREIKPREHAFLKEMLYQAIFVEDENTVVPRSIIEHPDLKKYIEDFGRSDDFCLVAEQNENLIGAIWIRRIKGYGFVDNETPELSMAVLKGHRGKGIGKRLLETMIARLTNGRFKQVSLSVDKANFAYGLYKKHGFVDYHSFEKSITMIRRMTDD